MPSRARPTKAGDSFVLIHHAGCGLMVVAFVHFYSLYQLVAQRLGSSFLTISPVVLPVLFLAVLFFRRYRIAIDLPPIRRLPVIAGLCCCLAALALPDPEIAVKRIHVMEYLLLSLYVRHTLSFRLSGNALLAFSCLLTCLYGVHDELLQGLHPSRTYGLRDMLVNCLAAVGGGLMWHGLGFSAGQTTEREGRDSWPRPLIIYLGGLAAAVPAMAVPLIAHRHDVLPAWPFLPLSAAIVFLGCYLLGDRSEFRYGLLPVSVVACLFLLYPLAVNGLQIAFH